MVELTYNYDPEDYQGGRNFGHLAYEVDDIYATCQRLLDGGVTINRPPRDGHMAFVRSPDGISIELLQKGGSLPQGRALDLDAQRRRLVAGIARLQRLQTRARPLRFRARQSGALSQEGWIAVLQGVRPKARGA